MNKVATVWNLDKRMVGIPALKNRLVFTTTHNAQNILYNLIRGYGLRCHVFAKTRFVALDMKKKETRISYTVGWIKGVPNGRFHKVCISVRHAGSRRDRG